MTPSILVACIGNIFLGDDAFGVEVARALQSRLLPPAVTVKDFGIRGFDLAYDLLAPWRAVILVDAMQRGEAPGALYLFDPDLTAFGSQEVALNPHGMDPFQVLALAASLGTLSAPITILGCEPSDFGDELEGRMGLSPAVQAAVEEAADMIEDLAARILAGSLEPGLAHLQPLER